MAAIPPNTAPYRKPLPIIAKPTTTASLEIDFEKPRIYNGQSLNVALSTKEFILGEKGLIYSRDSKITAIADPTVIPVTVPFFIIDINTPSEFELSFLCIVVV